MAELFPQDPKLRRFASRFSGEGFDPTAVHPIISPAMQMRPKALMQSIKKRQSVREESPQPTYGQEDGPRP